MSLRSPSGQSPSVPSIGPPPTDPNATVGRWGTLGGRGGRWVGEKQARKMTAAWVVADVGGFAGNFRQKMDLVLQGEW